jgi:hypothetical protein
VLLLSSFVVSKHRSSAQLLAEVDSLKYPQKPATTRRCCKKTKKRLRAAMRLVGTKNNKDATSVQNSIQRPYKTRELAKAARFMCGSFTFQNSIQRREAENEGKALVFSLNHEDCCGMRAWENMLEEFVPSRRT